MIKGLAITPPVIGRISIGHLVQKGEKWIPVSLLEIDETAPTHHQDNTLKINGIL